MCIVETKEKHFQKFWRNLRAPQPGPFVNGCCQWPTQVQYVTITYKNRVGLYFERRLQLHVLPQCRRSRFHDSLYYVVVLISLNEIERACCARSKIQLLCCATAWFACVCRYL